MAAPGSAVPSSTGMTYFTKISVKMECSFASPFADADPCVFFKPKKQNPNARKRNRDDEKADASEEKTEIVKATSAAKKSDNMFTVRPRKYP